MDRESNLAAFLAGNHPDVPRVMYHGTKYGNIDKFKGYRGSAGHFAFTPKEASDYAKGHDEVPHDDEYFHEEGPQVYPVHISAKNVFDARNPDHVKKIRVNPRGNWDYEDLEHSVSAMKKAGFDSYFDFEYGISQMQNDGSRKINEPTGIAVFHPHQIKSATGNQGTFDPNDPDITKDKGGEVDGITAYHGSPHEFEQFDTSKIGTGEGAQAYGHGLYFSESHPIADDYRIGLSNKEGQQSLLSGRPLNEHYKKLEQEANRLHPSKASGHYEKMSVLENMMMHEHPESILANADDRDLSSETKEWIKNKVIPNYKQQGHMYEVNINAHPDHFLDWDKPLSDQSPHIMKSLIEHRKENPTMWEKIKPHLDSDETAGTIYQHLAAGHPHGYAGASEWLQRAGIHGIRYLDAGSRGAEENPTHNYVVFDHDRVNIKRRYAEGGEVERDGFGFGGDTVGAGSGPVRGATGSASAARAAREAPAQQAAPAESRQETRGYRDMPPDLLQAQLDLNARGRAATEAMQEANRTRMPFGYVGRGAPSAYDIANQEHMPNWLVGPPVAPTTFGDNSIVAGGVFTGGAKQQTPVTHYESTPMQNQIDPQQKIDSTLLQNQIDYATPPLPVSRPAPMPAPRPASVTPAPPMPTPRPADLQPSFIKNLGSAVQDILSVPGKIVSGIGNAFTQQPQQQQPQPQGGNRGRRLVKKLMPDGTYQDVWEEYAHGGVAKYHSNHHNPAIVEYALNKISAPPPALDPTLMVAKRGRPF